MHYQCQIVKRQHAINSTLENLRSKIAPSLRWASRSLAPPPCIGASYPCSCCTCASTSQAHPPRSRSPAGWRFGEGCLRSMFYWGGFWGSAACSCGPLQSLAEYPRTSRLSLLWSRPTVSSSVYRGSWRRRRRWWGSQSPPLTSCRSCTVSCLGSGYLQLVQDGFYLLEKSLVVIWEFDGGVGD